MEPSDIVGVVLAGGAGSRMGGAKAELAWGGSTLVERAAAVLRQALGEVVVAGPPVRGLPAVADRFTGKGPLAGVHAGLERAAGRPVFALACDLPFVPAALVRHLVAAADGDGAAWVAAGPRGPEPLCGLYAARCLAVAEQRLAGGEPSMHGFLEAIAAVSVPVTAELPFYRRELFLNLNRPVDLARARRLRAAATPR